MHLLSLNNIFAAPVISALCRTLVHSIWVGFLLAMITGIIMLSTKKSNAAFRYNLLTAAFISFIVSMLIIFIVQITTAVTAVDTTALSPSLSQTTTATAPLHFYFIPDKSSVTSTINTFLNHYSNAIVLIWFLIIVFRSIGFIGGIRKIQQLKNTQLSSAGEDWNKKLFELSQRLGIQRSIQFFQSGLARIPMVAGHFKPIILFPIGLLASLPPDEIEAILIHELAHIKRKDFLMNMLQHFAEILFFFNPAVLWTSALIKVERENCCDDIAVANTGNKRNYINALVAFQEYHLGSKQYAPAFANTKSHLLQRVKRMLYNNTSSLNKLEKTSLAVCMVLVAVMTVFFSNAGIITKKETALHGSVNTSTETENTVSTETEQKEKTAALKIRQAQQKADALKAKYDADSETAKKDSEMSEIDSKTSEKDSQWPDQNATHFTTDMTMSAALRADIDAKNAEQKKLQAEQQRKSEQFTQREIEWRKSIDGKALFVSKLTYSADNNTVPVQQAGNPLYSKAPVNYPAVYYNNYNYNPVAAQDEQQQKKKMHTLTGIQYNSASQIKDIDIKELTEDFINDLSSDKIISGINGLSYKMSSTSLIVNGVLQPEAIHKKLKEKYIQRDDWKLLYNWKE
ncbi:MAG: M56 family metallopeptidase [Ferruginibacter sp.]